MNFSKKQENNFPQRQSNSFKSNDVSIDWSKYVVDYEADIPNGKFSGKTLQWVKDNDQNYFSWMIKEGMIAKWGLIRTKESVIREQTNENYFFYRGYKCVGIMLIPGTGIELKIL